MAQFRITAPDGTVYNVTAPDGATEQDALEHLQSQLGQGAPAPDNRPTSQIQGAAEGVGNFISNAAEMVSGAGNAIGLPMDRIFNAVTGGHSLEETTQRLRNPQVTPQPSRGGTGGRIAADIAMSLPAVIAGPFSGGAAAGALTTPEGGNKGMNAAIGGVASKGLDLALRPIAQAIAPVLAPAVQRLREAGTQLTPGQLTGQGGLVGRAFKGLEDAASSIPFVGTSIRDAQNRSLETAGRGAINRSLAPIGQELPPNIIGQDAVRYAGDALSDNYDMLLPQMTARLDAPFAQEVGIAGQRVDARLPDEMGEQFQGTLADVFKKLGSGTPGPANTFPGRAAHEAASDLSASQRSYAPKGGNEGELGDAYGRVSQAFRANLTRSNPQLGPQIAANDEGWANLVRLEDASKAATGNASGKAPGVFTGQQLRTAARQGDHSVRDRATARGDALMQDYAEDMIQVLPSTIGDSGTASRLVLPAIAAGAAPFSLPTAAAAATIPAIYSRPGIAAINSAFARTNVGPNASLLGDMVRRLGRVGGVPTVAGMNGGGQ